MSRKTRLDRLGALHCIIVRDIERRDIFREYTDGDDFLKRLEGILWGSQTHGFAWALMSNHFHLLLRTEINESKIFIGFKPKGGGQTGRGLTGCLKTAPHAMIRRCAAFVNAQIWKLEAERMGSFL